nr:MAG: hypothetical protein [Marsupenaeus japonicus endogenous nimavirus]
MSDDHRYNNSDLEEDEDGIVYKKFCTRCIGKFRNVIISKMQVTENNILHDTVIDNAIVQYLENNSLSVIEHIEEEFIDNFHSNDKLQNNLLSSIPLTKILNISEKLKTKGIFKLTNISDHILLKGSLKGAIIEIDDRHGSNHNKENISLTFDEALLKCIPKEISCNCIGDEKFNNGRRNLYYNCDKDYNIDYSEIEYTDNVIGDETNEIINNSENDDSINNNNSDDGNDISLKTNEKESINNRNYRKSNNTVKLIGNGEKFICLEICKHKTSCPIDINNKHIINRNINIHVKESTPDNERILEITDSINNIVNNGNMLYILGSTTCRSETYMNKLNNFSNKYKSKLESLFISMNKNKDLTQQHISDLVSELNHTRRILQSFTISNLTYVAPMVVKLFEDQIVKEFNETYSRNVTTLYLGPQSRGNIYDESKIWMRDYIHYAIVKNNKINNGHKHPVNMIQVPLCGNKTQFGTHINLSNLYGKSTLLMNIRMVIRLINIINFIARDLHNKIINRGSLDNDPRSPVNELVKDMQLNISLTNDNNDNETSTLNTNNVHDKTLLKDYSLCIHTRKAFQETHQYLKDIFGTLYN